MRTQSPKPTEPAQFAVTSVVTPAFLEELRRCHLVGAQQGKVHNHFTRPVRVHDFIQLLPYLRQKATCDELVWLSITISEREGVANRSAMEKVLLTLALEKAACEDQREIIRGLSRPDKAAARALGLVGSGMAQFS